MTVIKTEWLVEGQTMEGEWHTVGRGSREADNLAYRDSVVKLFRQTGMKRYKKVRLARYVTTIEVIGEDITV